ncbi:hypothetical protein FB45DRAFT_886556 [Roridomyces roridus]|uniref:Uncharacterized protein n=1 Tax=Roridomyces roridus TaxID=1738132 RepID=A0AAD7CIE1_9AGAR|nr:hypothetical protein FB45DRAFT_886556 [Roridomyces roridus]
MFFRKASFLAFSAFSLLLSSVQTPKTLQPPEVVPVFPRHPVCWWDEYEPEVLPFSPANAFTNGSIVLAQGPLDVVPALAQINPSVSFDLASAQLAHTAPATLELAGSHLAGPNIAGFDLPSLDEVEGVFTATLALARLLKRKTGVVWTKLAISLLILSGMLALDALQLGEPGFLVAVLHCLPAKIVFAKTHHIFCSVLCSVLQGPLLPTLVSLLDVSLLDVVHAVALDRSLASPAPYTRKKKLFKRQRLKQRVAHGTICSSRPFSSHYRR